MRQILRLDTPERVLLDVQTGAAAGRMASANPVEEPPDSERDSWTICWSGWLGAADPGAGWFERSPGQWLPSARQTWDRAAADLDRVERMVLRPHARHLLSDGPGCLQWLRQQEGRRLLLDPVAMLEPEMLPDADDHVTRLLSTVGALAWGVVVSDVGVAETAERGAWCVPAPAGQGAMDMARFADGLRAHLPETCVLVGQSDEDVALLRTLG